MGEKLKRERTIGEMEREGKKKKGGRDRGVFFYGCYIFYFLIIYFIK